MSDVFDVVIVGAGLAGLSAAVALSEKRVLVLEREAQAGGRVRTGSSHGVAYDLGAVFAFDPARSPVALQLPPAVRESERIGLHQDGVTHWGSSVEVCIQQLRLDAGEQGAFAAFAAGELDATRLPSRLARALGSFFHVIHPGSISDALPERQRDALVRFPIQHHRAGNGQLVEALAQAVGPRLRLSNEVQRIEEKPGLVELTVRTAGGVEVLAARAVLCATPAPTAARLITSLTNDRCRGFLEGQRWGGGTVVVLGLKDADLPDFSYLVTPDRSFNTVLHHRGVQGQPDLLFVYYIGSPAPSPRLADTLAELRTLGISAFREEWVVFSESQRWEAVGPSISAASYGRFDDWETRACERVFLAGDYTFVEQANVLPFGMDQALASGAAAAKRVRAYLDVPSVFEQYRSEHLIESTLYHLSGERPSCLQTKEECNISYWGTVLQAERDPALVQYLLGNTRAALWEYQTGFGVTSDDTVLVCEGLFAVTQLARSQSASSQFAGAQFAADQAAEALGSSLRRLVELFYAPELGAFLALSPQRHELKACAQGRAEYWLGPSLDATAQAAWLLGAMLPGEYTEVIARCARFVAEAQHPDGSFSGLWFPTTLLTTWHAVRLLAAQSPVHDASVRRALAFIAGSQSYAGGWFGSVIETSAAALALNLLGQRTALPAALNWIQSRRLPDGSWSGEPLLYYWFETAPGQKLLFHCRDRGRVTTAWARLAIQTIQQTVEGDERGTFR